MKKRFTNVLLMFMIIMFSIVSAELNAATKTWDGGISTDWNNPTNWIGGLPLTIDDVVIPGSLQNYPNIISGQNLTVKNITINSTGRLAISGGSLTLSERLFVNGGTLKQTGGVVITNDFESKNGGLYYQEDGEFRINRNFVCPPGNSFTSTGGTIRFTGSGNGASRFTGNIQFFNIVIDSGVDPDFDSQANSTIKVGGNFSNYNSNLNMSTKITFIFNGTGSQTIYSASSPVPAMHTFGHLSNEKTSGSLTLLSDISVAGTFIPGATHTELNGNVLWVGDQIYTGPLPVELASFSASIKNNRVFLSWKTISESQNYGFDIERASASADQSWEKIGFVNGHGNSNSPKDYSFEDHNSKLSSYYYRLKQIDNDGSFAYSNIVKVNIDQLPNNFALNQNYPNPFNPSTKISWQSPVSSRQTLKVYDIIGNEVATLVDEFREAGNYEIDFNASQLTSGVYVYKITAGEFSDTKKMLLTK